jgi:hypothetical protein
LKAAGLKIKQENPEKNVPPRKLSKIETVAVLHLGDLPQNFSIMLDPLTSLGLASNIVQLIHFSTDLVSSVKEVHQYGSSIDVQSLRTVASSLRTLRSNVASRSWSSRAGGEVLEEVEKVM